MSRRILVPIDGSRQSKAAAEYATELYPDATIVLLSVVDQTETVLRPDANAASTATPAKSQQGRAETLFEEVKGRIGPDRTIETAVVSGRPTREIVAYAAEAANDVDAIVMGSHGRDGAARLLLGSVAETVVRRSPVPVTVAR
ncbi:MAG: universal stress protein [Halobacteriota archaeon]